MVKVNVKVNVIDDLGMTPLHHACMRGKLRSVKFLLSKGASPFERDIWGRLPLHKAVCHPKLLNFLLKEVYTKENVNEITSIGETPLHIACADGVTESVQLLLEYGAEPNAKDEIGRTPLHEACIYGHLEIVKLLIEAGADPTIKSNCGLVALNYACWNEHVEIVEYLLNFSSS